MLRDLDLKNGFTFYPGQFSVLPTNFIQIPQSVIEEEVEKLRWENVSKENKSTPLILNVTGGCNASCEYCYANRFYSERDYLKLDTLKEYVEKHNIDLKGAHVVLIGGEPLLYLNLFEELVSFLDAKGAEITVLTGLFVEDKDFDYLKELYKKYSLTFLVSLDVPDQYKRRYKNYEGLAAYDFVYEKFKELYKIDRKKVGINSTLSKETGYFPWIEKMEEELGLLSIYGFGYNSHCVGNPYLTLEEFKQHLERRQPNLPKKERFSLFNIFNTRTSFVGIMKECYQEGLEHIINNKGERIACCRDMKTLAVSTKEGWYGHIYSLNHPTCSNCELKDFCQVNCIHTRCKTYCEIKYLFLEEWIKRTKIEDLISKSLIKVNIV